MTVQDLNKKLKQGYAVTTNMKQNLWSHCGYKKAFNSTQIVFFDLDNIKHEISFEDFCNSFRIKPTLIYTSHNHGKRKDNEDRRYSRYRLLYLFDSPITSQWLYNKIQDAIQATFNLNIYDNSKATDTCHKSVYQLYFGNPNRNFKSQCNEILNLNRFLNIFHIDPSKEPIAEEPKAITEKAISPKQVKELVIDKTLLQDFMKLDFKAFLSLYEDVYSIVTTQDVAFNEKGYAIADFAPLKRNPIKRYRDGQGRRKNIFSWGLYRKCL